MSEYIIPITLASPEHGLAQWFDSAAHYFSNNAYLEAKTREMIYIIADPEFGPLEGKILLIDKALYGLKTSGARYREHFADYLRSTGWKQSKADPDIWMMDMGTHWEYLCTYIDDLIIMSKDPQKFMDEVQKAFKMKGVGPPTYHLGSDFIQHSRGSYLGVQRPT